ncbi:metal ABC transporter permease [Terribacillus sp. DMT04]|uniref:metal ABC transporter permease n=1 Tax=Terribacillus sp. DMT04 TaxID=2850441 RepID=UPI001C2C6389|nr:metal ABC transporter permease [Terribacillus sp. DMT04]QXE02747.1 metal ABC transporter permease [Terribacillus sp. DMT04]
MTYEGWILLTACLVGISCGTVGCFLIIRRMTMLADAISHSVLLGIVLTFLIANSLDGMYMLIGAAVIGFVTTFAIQSLHQAGVQEDASIGIVFTTFFAIGVILLSLFAKDVHLDVEHALMGEIAFLPFNTHMLLGFEIPKATSMLLAITVFTLVVITLFYKELKITSFDAALALTLGLPVTLIHYLLMGLVSITAVGSFDAVGAILVVSMLVVPGVSAYLLTDRLSFMLLYSCVFGIASAVFGYYGAVWLDVSISGAMSTAGGILFLLTWIFSPRYGLLRRFTALASS